MRFFFFVIKPGGSVGFCDRCLLDHLALSGAGEDEMIEKCGVGPATMPGKD